MDRTIVSCTHLAGLLDMRLKFRRETRTKLIYYITLMSISFLNKVEARLLPEFQPVILCGVPVRQNDVYRGIFLLAF